MSEEVADWIADTREYIEKNGWWKKAYRGPNGKQVCTAGALFYSHNLNPDDAGTRDLRVVQVARAICRVIPGVPDTYALNTIYDWNDDEDRTKQQVLDALAKAEKIERAGYDPDAA